MTDKEFENLEIGKNFKLGNITLIVEEAEINSCVGCFFYNLECLKFSDCMELPKGMMPNCDAEGRKDCKDVVFKEVENDY